MNENTYFDGFDEQAVDKLASLYKNSIKAREDIVNICETISQPTLDQIKMKMNDSGFELSSEEHPGMSVKDAIYFNCSKPDEVNEKAEQYTKPDEVKELIKELCKEKVIHYSTQLQVDIELANRGCVLKCDEQKELVKTEVKKGPSKRNQMFFNCSKSSEVEYKVSKYEKPDEVRALIKDLCKSKAIHYSTHEHVHSLIQSKGYRLLSVIEKEKNAPIEELNDPSLFNITNPFHIENMSNKFVHKTVVLVALEELCETRKIHGMKRIDVFKLLRKQGHISKRSFYTELENFTKSHSNFTTPEEVERKKEEKEKLKAEKKASKKK